MEVTEFKYLNRFNDTLIGNKWLIDSNYLKGIVIIVTGMNEYSLRYNEFALFLNRANYLVYSLDHYGQYKNGTLGYPSKNYFYKMSETLDSLIIDLKKKYNLPVYIFSHSMGSFITQKLIEDHSEDLDKVILCGSSYDKYLYKVANILATLIVNKFNEAKPSKLLYKLSIGSYNKKFKKEGKSAWLSTNLESNKKYNLDKYCNYLDSNRFYKEFFKGLSSLYKKDKLERINKNIKILLIGGKDDPVSNFSKNLEKLDNLYRKYHLNSRLIIYKNKRHELLNELNNLEVYNDILNFYEE